MKEEKVMGSLKNFFITSGIAFTSSKDLCEQWIELTELKRKKGSRVNGHRIKKFEKNPETYLRFCHNLLYKKSRKL